MNGIDRAVFEWFVEQRQPWLTTVMQVLTTLGGSAFLIPLVLALGGWYRWRHRIWRPFVLLAASYVGALALSNGLKALFGRPRPPVAFAIGEYASPALPSGHATHAAAVWLMVGLVVAAGGGAAVAPPRRRRIATGVAVVSIVFLVGVSRLYLAAHWLSDVLAGWAIGTAWSVATNRLFAATTGREP